ncbi:hypothetical protein BDW69DRAFT_53120 [Aspergillus filifer]
MCERMRDYCCKSPRICQLVLRSRFQVDLPLHCHGDPACVSHSSSASAPPRTASEVPIHCHSSRATAPKPRNNTCPVRVSAEKPLHLDRVSCKARCCNFVRNMKRNKSKNHGQDLPGLPTFPRRTYASGFVLHLSTSSDWARAALFSVSGVEQGQ